VISDDDLLVLDTCVVLQYLRAKPLGIYIERTFNLRNRSERPVISIVTHAELLSLARRGNWDAGKQSRLDTLLHEFVTVDISTQDIIEKYAEIDCYALGLPSSRHMGKNDLWIAATASLAGAHLLTTDKDFEPLDRVFFDLVWIDPTST